MKNRQVRLNKAEIEFLGLEPREGYICGNPKYRIHRRDYEKLLKFRNKTNAKILVFDIETAPSEASIWSLWQKYVTIEQLTNPWYMLTWSAKWLFDKNFMSARLTSEEAINRDDSRIVKGMFDLLDEADVVIAHNGDKFDIAKLNARFLYWGFGTPSSFMSIDTWKHSKKAFNIESHKLEFLARYLGIPGKFDMKMENWLDAVKGFEEALKEMEVYNINDVRVLEEVYLVMRPFIKPHPNLGLFLNNPENTCPTCGSLNLKETGFYLTTVNTFPEYTCLDCGSNCRGRKANKRSDGIMSSLPR